MACKGTGEKGREGWGDTYKKRVYQRLYLKNPGCGRGSGCLPVERKYVEQKKKYRT